MTKEFGWLPVLHDGKWGVGTSSSLRLAHPLDPRFSFWIPGIPLIILSIPMSVVVKLALGTHSNLFFHWFGLVAFYLFMFFVVLFLFFLFFHVFGLAGLGVGIWVTWDGVGGTRAGCTCSSHPFVSLTPEAQDLLIEINGFR